MASESVTRTPTPVRASGADAVRSWFSKYGLIILLAALPVCYGIKDLADDGNLVRLGESLGVGLSNGTLVAFGLWGTIGLTLATGTLGIVFGLLAALVVAMAVCGVLNVMIERVDY